VTSPTGPQLAVAEERRTPAVVEAQQAMVAAEARPEAEIQPAASVVVALLAASAVESRPAPAAAETRPEAAAAAPQQEPATMEVVVEARQEPALAVSSQATAVEIPDDDVPPPGWDQWASLPSQPPSPRRGRLLDGGTATWWPGAGGTAPRLPLPASAPLLRARSASTSRPPILPTPRRSSSCGRSSAITAPRSTER
jgi:hypothetical protein